MDSTGTFGRKLPSTSVLVDDDAMAHPMEAEYVMIESVRDAQPDVEDVATISSPGMASLDQAADAASAALRHAEAEGARAWPFLASPFWSQSWTLRSRFESWSAACRSPRSRSPIAKMRTWAWTFWG